MTDLGAIGDAARRGELAQQMVAKACELACLVRDCDQAEIGEFLTTMTGGQKIPEEVTALLVVAAAMIPLDQTAQDLLSWVTWDEYGNPLPGVPRDAPRPRRLEAPDLSWEPERELKPCGTYAARSRHHDHGEEIDPGCEAAAREYWTGRKRAQKARKEADHAA